MTITEIFASNLRGHDYIKARGLSPQIVNEQSHTCENCRKLEMLPAVIQLTERWPMKQKKVRRIK